LPYGSSAALKFLNYIDPALKQDLNSDTPWAFSPMLSTMNKIHVSGQDGNDLTVSKASWEENVEHLTNGTSTKALAGDVAKRRKWFADEENRKSVKISQDVRSFVLFCGDWY
jgi:hypothetical protein